MFEFISENYVALEIVKSAIERSHPVNKSSNAEIIVFISPREDDFERIKFTIKEKRKVIILGTITPSIADLLQVEIRPQDEFSIRHSMVCIEQEESCNTSSYFIDYNHTHELSIAVPYEKRFFTRFDFMDEWNNHGYGRIGIEKDIWSTSQIVTNRGAHSLAQIMNGDKLVSEFVTVTDFDTSSVLFINRDVGLVDGLDVCIVENFISSYRSGDLPVAPLLLDIPYGCSMVVSPRLDCDQSIINSRPLVDLYRGYDIQLSLAVTTGINILNEECSYLNEFYETNKGLLSHTVNHLLDWGDCYETVYREAKTSKQWLDSTVNNSVIQYAVSPFHTNKPFSLEALHDAGYRGFISGIIHNDPEYLIATSGRVPFTRSGLVSHSQQCMLHGDCIERAGGLRAYKESFAYSYKTKKMFGYLDHPFGDYDYGWTSEQERLNFHREFIEYINTFDGVMWMTSDELLEFVYEKSKIRIELDDDGEMRIKNTGNTKTHSAAVEYYGKIYEC